MTEESFSVPTFIMSEYDFYRVDEWIFWTFLFAGMIFCAIHAARRAFRQPRPTGTPDHLEGTKGKEGQRYTLFQRVFHWTNSGAVFLLILSGLMIYQPHKVSLFSQTTSFWFVLHSWGVALLLVGWTFHVIYESFLVQEPNPMTVNREEIKRLLAILKNFFGLSKSYPQSTKYHPGQIFFHWAVAGNLILLTITGFIIWKPLRDLLPLSLFGLGWDLIFYSRLLHGFFSAALIPSLMGHIYFALMIKKNWPETKSMVTGRVSLHDCPSSHSPNR